MRPVEVGVARIGDRGALAGRVRPSWTGGVARRTSTALGGKRVARTPGTPSATQPPLTFARATPASRPRQRQDSPGRTRGRATPGRRAPAAPRRRSRPASRSAGRARPPRRAPRPARRCAAGRPRPAAAPTAARGPARPSAIPEPPCETTARHHGSSSSCGIQRWTRTCGGCGPSSAGSIWRPVVTTTGTPSSRTPASARGEQVARLGVEDRARASGRPRRRRPAAGRRRGTRPRPAPRAAPGGNGDSTRSAGASPASPCAARSAATGSATASGRTKPAPTITSTHALGMPERAPRPTARAEVGLVAHDRVGAPRARELDAAPPRAAARACPRTTRAAPAPRRPGRRRFSGIRAAGSGCVARRLDRLEAALADRLAPCSARPVTATSWPAAAAARASGTSGSRVPLPAGEGEQDPHYAPAAIEAATSATIPSREPADA